jgi:glycosyltransferase involved in cell wall biosynthesis
MGGGTRHIEIGRELVKRGWRVLLVASDFHVHQRTYQRRASMADHAAHYESVDGVDVAWLWASPYARNDLRRVANWLTFARSAVTLDLSGTRPRVVVGSSPHLFAALAAWVISIRHRVPFVLEVRDLWPESLAVAGRPPGAGYAAFWLLARFLYRVADRVIVLAEGVESYLADRGVPKEKLVFIPNGVDTSSFAAVSPPHRDSLRLIYAGAHGPANGLDAVLDAAEALRDEPRVSFVLLGDGPAKPALQESSTRRQLNNLQFIDSIPKSEMPSFLAGCDAGLMVLKDVPVFAFGVSPNKLFDYWAASLPVVCNVPGEVAMLVRRADGGIQAADSSGAALAAAIRAMVALTPAERASLGASGRCWVERERSRPALAERMERMLSSLDVVAA